MAISEKSGVISYSTTFATWARVFIGLLGVATVVLGPATMVSIAVPGWTWSFAFTVVTGTMLFMFGIFALIVALSATMTLEFRISEQVLVISRRGPLGHSRRQRGFADVSPPTLEIRDSEDGPYPVLTLRLVARRFPLTMSGFIDADDARQWQQRLADVLAARN